MTTKYQQNKKYALKWIENNKDKYNEVMRNLMKRNYDDDKREQKRQYYQLKKQIGLLREFPFFNSEVIEL
jgi:hypothetical protein